MVKIGIDGRVFNKPLTGVGKYVTQLLNRINEVAKYETTFYIYNNNKDIDLSECRFKHVLRVDERGFAQKMKPVVWLKFFSKSCINADELDYFIGGAGFLPHLSSNIKTIVVVHDFNHIIVPATMTFTQKIAHQLFYKSDVKKADYVIVNSQGTFDKTIKYFKKTPDIIVNPAVDSVYKKLDIELVTGRLKELTISKPYLLAVATLEPRKNLGNLVRAFIKLRSENYLKEHKLVLVGKFGWKNEEIRHLINQNKDIIQHLGYLSNKDLAVLYNGASLFVFPSVYEGYGMPVAEALACRTQSITTNISELVEASKGQASYIGNVSDINSICKAILNAFDSPPKQIIMTGINEDSNADFCNVVSSWFNLI
ncbi:glycosyltransferase family 1 protein [Mucilaginibacter sp. PAMB04168]|uniref:glycosyltransferase family 4 protein n=1 Tax=Mucilaginibacter sp. PAMB04168 TaxID=3138567 RepID=UPI0031F6F3A9